MQPDLSVIADRSRFVAAQDALRTQLIESANRRVEVSVGFQGGSVNKVAYYNADSDYWGFWLGHRVMSSGRKRYWNAFGIGQPVTNKGLTITVEINVPLQGVNRRLGGVFLEDPVGNFYLGHRGKIGGGRVGIGKALFEREFPGTWIDVQDGDRISGIVLIGEIGVPDLPTKLGAFVHGVARMKARS